MFERPDMGEAAILVSLDFGDSDFRESTAELELLALSAGVSAHALIEGRRQRPDAATFAGSGKVQEIAAKARETGATLIIFNHELSPAQERNLERAIQARVVDRTGLILDIFAQRARSHEGKLQVELAQLQHVATRLVRGWTHLERQRGGIGLRGPGETQLETDRRLLAKRVKVLKDKLHRVRRQRATQRSSRRRNSVFSLSLVGYTNAGKSTLFNRLTRAETYAADKLFATLDTTTHKLFLHGAGAAVISDTVGFIRHLPHGLVAAFRATLEETVLANLLLHVVDAASGERDQQIDEVNKVLKEIGADQIPQLLIYNKIDLAPELKAGVVRDEYGKIAAVRVSALTGEGLNLIAEAVAEIMTNVDEYPMSEESVANEAPEEVVNKL
ncbi:MAG TPA: ribosome rescue GTPase HflX [Burkholderiales bacterium]|nr:ribosome rescue GTPase HflX [Burkholderiales bacterium]